jgi:hypothetical protein
VAKKPLITVDLALGRLEHGSYWIVGNRAAITPAFVRELLGRDSALPRHTMLKLAVPLDCSDDDLMQRWTWAADALRGLDLTYAWGSKALRARVRELARDPGILAAIQGVVGLTESPPATMLAVLVADGGDASIDALIPHLGGALETRDSRLDWLRRLRTHAADTPRLDALFAELDTTYDERNATSPALALGPIIGIGEVDELWFDAGTCSVEVGSGGASRVQGGVAVDSRRPAWFGAHLSVRQGGDYTFASYGLDASGDDDRYDLGPCVPAELPAWLARAATKLGIAWMPFAPRTSLRGKKRARLEAWLAGK